MFLRYIFLLATLFVLQSFCNAASKDVRVAGQVNLPNVSQYFHAQGKPVTPQSASFVKSVVSGVPARVLVNGGEKEALVNSDGSFALALPEGLYVLNVVSTLLDYSSILLDVYERNGELVSEAFSVQNGQRGERLSALHFTPSGPSGSFRPKETFNIMAIFKNPMILIFGGMFLLTFLTDSLKEEEPQQSQQQQPQQQQKARARAIEK